MSDDQFFIKRHDRVLLRDLLASLPPILADLEATVTKQARVEVSVRGGRSKKPSVHPWPYYVEASEAREALHANLVGWVRLVLEHRGMTFEQAATPRQWLTLAWMGDEFVGPQHPDTARPATVPGGPPTTAALVRWLYRQLIPLALTPGAEDAYRDLNDHRKALQRFVCPPERRLGVMDARRVEQARALQLNARGIAALATELGEEYRNLTQRRVRYLADHGHVKPMPGLSQWRVFIVGEVLDAHLNVANREKHAIGA